MSLSTLSPAIFNTITTSYILLAGERAAAEPLLRLMSELAPHNPIGVIDAGMYFNPHYIARQVRKRSIHVQQALENIHIVRIFHAHQFPEALNGFQQHDETLIIMGGMVLFEDETMAIHHKRFVLNQYFNLLEQISATRPVIIGINPTERLLQYPWHRIYEHADQLFETDPMEEKINLQPGLFDLQEIFNGQNRPHHH